MAALAQLIYSLTHPGGKTMDLVFALGKWCHDGDLGNANVSPLPTVHLGPFEPKIQRSCPILQGVGT